MTNDPSEENATPPPELPKQEELAEEQLDQVSGGTGRTVQDCEGYTYMTQSIFGAPKTSTTLKSE